MSDTTNSGTLSSVNDYNNNTARSATQTGTNHADSEIVHTPSIIGDGSTLAATGFLPVSGALGGNPAGLIGSNTAVSAPMFTGPAAYNVVAPLTDADDGNASLAQSVENALAEEPTINAGSLTNLRIAASANGVVELSGTVESEHDRKRAAEVVGRLAGVAQVVNRLSIG